MPKIVLDTNCLISSLSSYSKYFPIWRYLQEGKFIICVSKYILDAIVDDTLKEQRNSISLCIPRLALSGVFVHSHLVRVRERLYFYIFFSTLFLASLP